MAATTWLAAWLAILTILTALLVTIAARDNCATDPLEQPRQVALAARQPGRTPQPVKPLIERSEAERVQAYWQRQAQLAALVPAEGREIRRHWASQARLTAAVPAHLPHLRPAWCDAPGSFLASVQAA